MCMPVFVFVFIDIIFVCLEVEVDDDEEVLIFDESRDLNCDSVSLLIQRSVSTLINLVKVIDRVAHNVQCWYSLQVSVIHSQS